MANKPTDGKASHSAAAWRLRDANGARAAGLANALLKAIARAVEARGFVERTAAVQGAMAEAEAGAAAIEREAILRKLADKRR